MDKCPPNCEFQHPASVIGFPIGKRFGLNVILVLMGVIALPANVRSADAI
jgi:hypothetical protein